MMIISGGICLGLLPFAIYRFWMGEIPIAIMNSTIVAGTAIVFLHLWLTKTNNFARAGIVVLTMFALVSTIHFKGAENLHWVYPALAATFFLLSPVVAAYLSAFFLMVVLGTIFPDVTFLFLLTYAVSAGATFLFSFAFSRRMRTQAEFLQQLATTDPLTGTGNRRKLEEKLLDITKRIKRYPKQTCSLIIFDIDYFKQVNDNYGHGVGDEVLQRFAEVIIEGTREADSFFRLGGEEFVLVLENTQLFEAKTLAKKLAREIEATNWHIEEMSITTSAGVAQFDGQETTYDWMQRADSALYRAKSAGRNRVITSAELLNQSQDQKQAQSQAS